MMQKLSLYSIFILLFCLPITTLASSNDAAMRSQRNQFAQAEKALQNNQWQTFNQLLPGLKNYPLYPYLLYEAKKKKLSQLSLKDLSTFNQTYPNAPFHTPLQEEWLRTQAKQNNWQAFLAGYADSKQPDLQCYAIWAKYQIQKKPEILSEAKSLWLTGTSQHPACDPVFETWEKTIGLDKALIWDRIRLAIQKRNDTLVHYLIPKLSPSEQSVARLWLRVRAHPNLIKQEKLFADNHPLYADIRMTGLERIAIQDAEEAAQLWPALNTKGRFTPQQQIRAISIIAERMATQHRPQAQAWLNRIPEDALTDSLREWKVRAAIRAQAWSKVIETIASLPPSQQNQNAWQYWLARAYQQTHQSEKATAIYQSIAASPDYYGFMASKWLNQPHNPKSHFITAEAVPEKAIITLPNVKRALELKAIGRDAQARKEWLMAIQTLSEPYLITATRFADRLGFHDWSVMAISRTRYHGDMSLRFPLAYQQDIVRTAQQLRLDPAWLFAITRQESAFKSDALSPVGALGLMQLMPQTAREVTKKHKMGTPSEKKLIEPTFNIQVGSRYLRSLYESLNQHTILATAAYNAGPSRIKQWLPDQPIDADAWIETIPFQETRHYVKNVIAYYSIYRQRLGDADDMGHLVAHVAMKD